MSQDQCRKLITQLGTPCDLKKYKVLFNKAGEPLIASLLLVAMPGAHSSFLLLLVRHLLLEAMHLFLIASLPVLAETIASAA